MGFDLDMTRGYNFNRGHINRMHAKRQFMRQLYMKGLEKRDYSYKSDDVPAEIQREIKKEIRRKYRIMRAEMVMRSLSGFIILLTLLFLLVIIFVA